MKKSLVATFERERGNEGDMDSQVFELYNCFKDLLAIIFLMFAEERTTACSLQPMGVL
jgi:hypothetical protein